MGKLVFTIEHNNLVFSDGLFKLPLVNTNIDNSIGVFRGGFYWEAQVFAYDEQSRCAKAKIVNYHEEADKYFLGGLRRFRFEYLHFVDIDKDEILKLLYPSSSSVPTAESLIVRQATKDEIVTHDGTLHYIYRDNGGQRKLQLPGRPYEYYDRKMFCEKEFFRYLGKNTVSVVIYKEDGFLKAKSTELLKVLHASCETQNKGEPIELQKWGRTKLTT